MKHTSVFAVSVALGLGLVASACAQHAAPANSAARVQPVNRIHPTGLNWNGSSTNGAAQGAMSFEGVEIVRGQLVRR